MEERHQQVCIEARISRPKSKIARKRRDNVQNISHCNLMCNLVFDRHDGTRERRVPGEQEQQGQSARATKKFKHELAAPGFASSAPTPPGMHIYLLCKGWSSKTLRLG